MRYKKIVFFLSLCIFFLSTTGFSYSLDVKMDNDWESRRAFIEENIINISSQGPDKVNEWLIANGFQEVEYIKTIEPLSSPGSVVLRNIQGYYDSVAKKYIVKGWWSWQGIHLVDSTAGALDGVSLAMCQTNWNPVTGYVFTSNPAGIAVYDQDYTHYPHAGGASKIDKSGIVYTFQDAWQGSKYVGYHGQVWFWLNSTPSQLPIYIKMDFEHTWTNANLSSFGFNWPVGSAPTINMVFNITPANFKIANQITLSSWH